MNQEATDAVTKKILHIKTKIDVVREITHYVFILLFVSLLIVAYNFKDTLQAIHDYQQHSCQVAK